MTILQTKIELAVSMMLLRFAAFNGNISAQQMLSEQIVSLHIKLQIAREKAINEQLISSI